MLPPAMRPRFVLECHDSVPEVMERIDQALLQPDCPVRGYMRSRHICLSLPEEERHFWSPTLDLDLEPTEQGCRLRGYFGPQPNTWTMYLAGFACLILVAGASLLIASSQWILDQPPTALWALPVCLALLAALYLAALGGQSLSAAQIERIRQFVDQQVDKSKEHSPA